MGVMDSLGLSNLGIDFSSVGSGIGNFLVFIFVALVIGGVGFFFYKQHQEKKAFKYRIPLFQTVAGQPVRIGQDLAKDFLIPNTTTRIWFLKNMKIFIPIATISMAKDEFWHYIRNNRELVNVSLSDLNKNIAEFNLNFDHNDMRLQNEELKQLISQNYKKQKWWQEYKDVIATVILILVLGVAFYLLADKLGKVIDSLKPYLDMMTKNTELQNKIMANLDKICSNANFK